MVTSGDFCVHGSELTSYVTGLEFLDELRYCWRFKYLVTFYLSHLRVTERCHSDTLEHVFWCITPCILVDRYKRFERIRFLLLRGRILDLTVNFVSMADIFVRFVTNLLEKHSVISFIKLHAGVLISHLAGEQHCAVLSLLTTRADIETFKRMERNGAERRGMVTGRESGFLL